VDSTAHSGSTGDTWIEDSVMIAAEHLRTDSCRIPISHLENEDHTMTTHDEATPKETLESPPSEGEEIVVSPPPGSGATTAEAEHTSSQPPRDVETMPPSSGAMYTNIEAHTPNDENSPIPLPLAISTVNAHPHEDEVIISSSSPKSNVVLSALPPAPEGEENKTSSVHDIPVMSHEEVMSLLSRMGRDKMTSPQETLSQYQRLWSWDDAATPLRPTPPPTQVRRAVTCRDRPHSNQQQQQEGQFNVAVLRRGGGGSFHTSSFHHASNHSLNLPPSK